MFCQEKERERREGMVGREEKWREMARERQGAGTERGTTRVRNTAVRTCSRREGVKERKKERRKGKKGSYLLGVCVLIGRDDGMANQYSGIFSARPKSPTTADHAAPSQRTRQFYREDTRHLLTLVRACVCAYVCGSKKVHTGNHV